MCQNRNARSSLGLPVHNEEASLTFAHTVVEMGDRFVVKFASGLSHNSQRRYVQSFESQPAEHLVGVWNSRKRIDPAAANRSPKGRTYQTLPREHYRGAGQ